MVLAELAGGIAHRFQHSGNGDRLVWYSNFCASLAYGGHSGANGKLTGDEVRTACGTARFGVVVGEDHAFSGHFVEIRCAPSHHAAAVSADIPNADVVTHDHDDVGFLLLGESRGS